MRKVLLLVSCFFLAIGAVGGPLITRLYFIHGGKRIWLSSWLQTAAFPTTLLPLAAAYSHRRKTHGPNAKLFFMKPFLFGAAFVIGILTGLVDYLYAYGAMRIPVSTSSLIYASQLAFTAGFAFLLVKQKFTPFSINTIVLLTVGSAVLAIHSSSDRPEGESNKEYIMGFVMMILAAVVYGFVLPLTELAYKKSKQAISYTLVMEYQMVMCMFATVFCTIGMIANKDFQAISREAREYELGEVKYYVVLVFNSIFWQCSLLGLTGVIFSASSLLSGILITLSIPVTEVMAVLIFDEKFTGEKGVSLVLSIWGFISYFYGEIKYSKMKNQSPEQESHQITPETELGLPVTQ